MPPCCVTSLHVRRLNLVRHGPALLSPNSPVIWKLKYAHYLRYLPALHIIRPPRPQKDDQFEKNIDIPRKQILSREHDTTTVFERPWSKILSSDAIFDMITTSPRAGAWQHIETTTFDYEYLATVVWTQINESPNIIHGEHRINTPQMNILKIHRAKRWPKSRSKCITQEEKVSSKFFIRLKLMLRLVSRL